ncbi:MAG TPA: hypothetical protein VD864_05245, partial [Nocardioides sp.]|nr:hypothetical protein [Nocardioides sp.]
SHSHTLRANTLDLADTNVPSPSASFAESSGGTMYRSTSNTQMSGAVLAPAGSDQPHNNMQPYLTFYFNIALQGVFPPRS